MNDQRVAAFRKAVTSLVESLEEQARALDVRALDWGSRL